MVYLYCLNYVQYTRWSSFPQGRSTRNCARMQNHDKLGERFGRGIVYQQCIHTDALAKPGRCHPWNSACGFPTHVDRFRLGSVHLSTGNRKAKTLVCWKQWIVFFCFVKRNTANLELFSQPWQSMKQFLFISHLQWHLRASCTNTSCHRF